MPESETPTPIDAPEETSSEATAATPKAEETKQGKGKKTQKDTPQVTVLPPTPEDSELLTANAPLPVPTENSLTAMGIKKSFGKRQVVKGLSLEVFPGEIVGLLGPNGAGKTTSFYMIAGVIPADTGDIFLSGKNVTQEPMHIRARQGLGYLSQERSVFRRLSVEDNLMGVLELTQLSKAERQERVDQTLEEMGLNNIRKTLGVQLSGGESRRTEIARALVLRPSFLLLDEPFAGVDPIAVLDIQEIIQDVCKRGIGVLITDHNVRETLGVADRAYIISNGEVLVQGFPDDLVNNEIARRIYLGSDFQL